MDFEMALINLAGLLGLIIMLIIALIKLGLFIFISCLIWSLIEKIIDYIKNKKDDFNKKGER